MTQIANDLFVSASENIMEPGLLETDLLWCPVYAVSFKPGSDIVPPPLSSQNFAITTVQNNFIAVNDNANCHVKNVVYLSYSKMYLSMYRTVWKYVNVTSSFVPWVSDALHSYNGIRELTLLSEINSFLTWKQVKRHIRKIKQSILNQITLNSVKKFRG